MESPIQSSFIPSDSVGTKAASPASRYAGGGADIIVLLSLVLFVASIALGVGVFLYDQYLGASNKSKVEQLQRAKAAFEPSLINELTRLDDRMQAGSRILENHLALTTVFKLLEDSTLQTVAFKSMSVQATERTKIAIKMQGVAQSVNSIALQADLYGKSGVISSPIFSNITRQEDGVHFDMSAVVNPNAIKYVQSVAATQSAAAAAAPQTQESLFGAPLQTP